MSDADAVHDEQAQTLGLLRWVQLAFMVFGLLVLWISDKLVTAVWSKFAEPNPTAVTAVAVVVAATAALVLYRNEKVNRVSHEVVGELARVTWPSGEETRVSTVVVIVTSVVAAAILGVFDWFWSAVTDLIYKV